MTTQAAGRGPIPHALGRVRMQLPRGGLLPDDEWRRRHRALVALLAAHAVVLGVAVWTSGFGLLHSLVEGSIVALAAAIAALPGLGRREREIAASVGLLSASAVLVHVSGGYIEMHFHFFVMIILISLYQDWWPFLVAVGYVVVHHGLVGTIDPSSVYNHPAAIADPWLWAGIHGTFILGASVAATVAWRLNEDLMTDRLAIELRARETAEAAVRLREEFLSIATHELRTPVTSVKGYAQLALRALADGDGRTAQLQRTLETLDGQADRLARLITQLLDVTRIEAGQLQLERVRTDIGLLVRQVFEAARQRSATTHRWAIDAPTGLEVDIDPERVEQVLSNLIENAVRYSPEGGTISIRVARDDRRVRIEVADEGIGIPPDRRARVFERFFQAHAERNYGGMGLGLYISRQIVERHGGSISCASREPRGTVFTVLLPVRAPGARIAPPREAGAPVAGPARLTAPVPAEIWIVEDDHDIRDLLHVILRDADYVARPFVSGADALEALDALDASGSPRPRLILLDKLMPEMDGTTFARRLRERARPYPDILALCAARDAAEWSASIGAVGHVSKPFSIEALLIEVARHVTRDQLPRATTT